MPATEREDLALITRAARSAGEIALGYFEAGPKSWHKGPNDPVSEADIAVNVHLEQILRDARPDYGWLSEESEDGPARQDSDRVFVIDPIDGTRAFLAEEPSWAVSIAVVEHGEPLAGVVYLPKRARTYAARRGGGATMDGAMLGPSRRPGTDGARLLASRPAMDRKYWPGGVPEVERHFRPSLAYRLCLVAEGRFDAMVTFRDSWEWDIAAGALIAAEAGARVTDRTGGRLTFNKPRPMTAGVMVAGPELHGILIGHMGGSRA